jgi:hypothetical protein
MITTYIRVRYKVGIAAMQRVSGAFSPHVIVRMIVMYMLCSPYSNVGEVNWYPLRPSSHPWRRWRGQNLVRLTFVILPSPASALVLAWGYDASRWSYTMSSRPTIVKTCFVVILYYELEWPCFYYGKIDITVGHYWHDLSLFFNYWFSCNIVSLFFFSFLLFFFSVFSWHFVLLVWQLGLRGFRKYRGTLVFVPTYKDQWIIWIMMHDGNIFYG